MTTATDPVADLLTTAGSLMSEPGTSNPEYDRALVELVRDLGLASDRTVALALLRQHSPHWSEHTTESRTLPLHCPQCGSSESLGTAEVLTGWAGARFFLEPDGTRTIEHGGYTDVHWDSSQSVGIHCRACDWGIETYDDDDGAPDLEALNPPTEEPTND